MADDDMITKAIAEAEEMQKAYKEAEANKGAGNDEDEKALSFDLPEETKTKKKRFRPDLANYGEENVEPGDNSRFLRYAMASWDLPPIDISDPVQVENRIIEYFTFCAENDRKPNIKGLGNWLGVDRSTVNSWRRGEYRKNTHSPIINQAVDILEELWWDYGQSGKVNPTSWIFIGKNAFGMKNQQDVVITPNNPLGEEQRPEALEAKYKELPEE